LRVLAQAREHFKSIHSWQADIEHYEIEVLLRGPAQRELAGRGAIHRVPRLAQGAGQPVGKGLVVFNEQYAQGRLSPSFKPRIARHMRGGNLKEKNAVTIGYRVEEETDYSGYFT
jgi:hypothetical protein